VTERRPLALSLAAAGVGLAVGLAGRSLADVAAPEAPNGALTGQSVGRAGFAYLTGLRQFAAALLWNRLDPQMHEYYGGVGLGKMVFMLPNVKAIVTLDPQFVEAYYVAPIILIDSGNEPGVSPAEAKKRLKAGLDLAKEGVDNNPKSGVLLVSYAELLFTRAHDLKGAVAYADRAFADDIIWRWDDEHWNSLAIMRAIYEKAGDTAKAAAAQAIMTQIENDPNATAAPADND